MIAIEEIKARKDGLDVLADIYRYAQPGAGPLPSDAEALLRW